MCEGGRIHTMNKVFDIRLLFFTVDIYTPLNSGTTNLNRLICKKNKKKKNTNKKKKKKKKKKKENLKPLRHKN